MLDPKLIRNEPEAVAEKLKKRRFRSWILPKLRL